MQVKTEEGRGFWKEWGHRFFSTLHLFEEVDFPMLLVMYTFKTRKLEAYLSNALNLI